MTNCTHECMFVCLCVGVCVFVCLCAVCCVVCKTHSAKKNINELKISQLVVSLRYMYLSPHHNPLLYCCSRSVMGDSANAATVSVVFRTEKKSHIEVHVEDKTKITDTKKGTTRHSSRFACSRRLSSSHPNEQFASRSRLSLCLRQSPIPPVTSNVRVVFIVL